MGRFGSKPVIEVALCLLTAFLFVVMGAAPVRARGVVITVPAKKAPPRAGAAGIIKIKKRAKRPAPGRGRTALLAAPAKVAACRRRRPAPRPCWSPRLVSARSYIVIDDATGEVLLARAPDRPAQPASTIKILTALIAINYLDDNDPVRASRRAAAMPRSKVYLRPGAVYRAGELIDAVLLNSANDASVALAEKIAGSERLFARMMTYKAGIWGARRTNCKTATGLTARGQYSTARDLAVLFNRAMENPEFARRVARIRRRTSFGRVLRNHNRALWRIHGAEGGKTGYTNAARQTYVGMFSRPYGEITVAIMGSETMWDDVARLVRAGFARLRSRRLDRRYASAAPSRKSM